MQDLNARLVVQIRCGTRTLTLFCKTKRRQFMQKRTKLSIAIVSGVMAVIAVFGALTYQVAYAQSPTPTPGAASQSAGQPGTPGQPGPGFGKHGGAGNYTDADLASALGITTEQLQAAYKTADSEALKEAVSKGLITQAQADQMAANNNTNERGHFGLFGKPGDTNTIDYNALLAKALGITTDKLQAAQTTATNASLDAAVKAGTLTQAQADETKGRNALAKDSTFQSAMKTAFEAAVKQAVSSGVITQAQADAILANQAQPGGFLMGGFDRGGRGGHGGPGGRDFNGGQNNTTTQNN
jgi:hypothetical protein